MYTALISPGHWYILVNLEYHVIHYTYLFILRLDHSRARETFTAVKHKL